MTVATEPLLKATTPDGRTCVQVLENDGHFKCTVTVDSKTVIEELNTQDQDRMLLWAKRQMTQAMRRCAKPA